MLKYVAFEKRLKEGGKKSRGGSQECKVRKAGGLNPLLPLKRSELNHATDMMEEYKRDGCHVVFCFKSQCASGWHVFISVVDVIVSIFKKTVKKRYP